MKASSIANANIALVKYWGKRDKKLILPYNSNISMTAHGLTAHTTVSFNKNLEDSLVLNGKRFTEGSKQFDTYIRTFLAAVKELYPKLPKIRIESKNNFPTAAGLASSAAGFAALAAAVDAALELKLDKKQLTMLSRRGSGSAARSIHGGFVRWNRGEKDDGSDSFAEQIAPMEHWPELRLLCCIVSTEEKKVKSRAGMAKTVETSPMYQGWLDSIDDDIASMENAIEKKDFKSLGEIAERNCLKMHSTMMTTIPSIIYWNDTTIRLMHAVQKFREKGVPCYFTMDAGPQVKVICEMDQSEKIMEQLIELDGVKEIIETLPGDGVRIVEDHLF